MIPARRNHSGVGLRCPEGALSGDGGELTRRTHRDADSCLTDICVAGRGLVGEAAEAACPGKDGQNRGTGR